MLEALEKLEKTIGCRVILLSAAGRVRSVWCSSKGPLCRMCQVKRDVCDELKKALKDTAILDTVEREGWTLLDLDVTRGSYSALREEIRNDCMIEGIEIKCNP